MQASPKTEEGKREPKVVGRMVRETSNRKVVGQMHERAEEWPEPRFQRPVKR